MNKSTNILICPLEWGLGHATRMIPLARKFEERNCRVFIGAGEELLTLFRSEMPEITAVHFPGFRPGYSGSLPQYIPLLLKTPILIFHTIREHYRLKKIIRDNNINIVISDNRFGLWNKKVKSVYVTHMPLIPFPKLFRFLEFIGVFLHRQVIKRYDHCFIPDLPGEINLSGRLSHGLVLTENVRFIGILSRFIPYNIQTTDNRKSEHEYDTIILSGPEPQRGILRDLLFTLAKAGGRNTAILEGKTGKGYEPVKSDNITVYPHLPSEKMAALIKGSARLVSRSGYTTVMELISLNCSALLIPTPGQTEQEYLAEYLSERGLFTTASQKQLKSLAQNDHKDINISGDINRQSKLLLEQAISELLA